MRTARTILLAILFLAVTVPAAAQDPTPPRISANIGVGLAMPFHGDFDFNAGAWQAALRVTVSPHMLIEGFVGQWRHTSERVLTNQVVQGPEGVIGRIDRVTIRTEHVRPAVGFNVLAAGSTGRAAFFAGGGAGLLLYRRDFTQAFDGCQVTGTPCTDTANRFTSGGFSVQAAAGLDIAIARRIGAFGEYRIAVPLEDVGFGQSSVVGGLRVTIW